MNKLIQSLLICLLITPTVQAEQYIPDTGQTKSYTDTFGEDSDYTRNPPSYTKLDESGNSLPDSATSWIMVKDNITGLIWEVKTDDGSIHDKDNTYTWQKAQDVFIAALNTKRFGGYSDWRIPTIKELANIMDHSKYSPMINENYFINTKSSRYWSATNSANSINLAWFASFHDGRVFCGNDSVSNKKLEYYVYAVLSSH